MGRYNFRPQRVHQAATQLLGTERVQRTPPWYDIVASVPPPEILVRTQPIQHRRPRPGTRKPSKLFHPQNISYPEDKLRQQFFRDHPWELARPRVVLENDGTDAHRQDWSRIRPPGQPLSGENVVQRQMWLMDTVQGMTTEKAYDQARREFYEERHQEDVERRIAKEEAMATGAYFGKSMLEIGMELEDKEYERWRAWATKEVTVMKQKQAASYTGLESVPVVMPEDDEYSLDSLADLEEDSPARKHAQS